MIAINTITLNSEIWRKLLNSIARKYDCGVKFTLEGGRLGYEGDRACAMEIAKETLALFGCDRSSTPPAGVARY